MKAVSRPRPKERDFPRFYEKKRSTLEEEYAALELIIPGYGELLTEDGEIFIHQDGSDWMLE